jgi:hypothetical protein
MSTGKNVLRFHQVTSSRTPFSVLPRVGTPPSSSRVCMLHVKDARINPSQLSGDAAFPRQFLTHPNPLRLSDLEEFPLATSLHAAVLKHGLTIMLVESTRSINDSWNGSVERVETATLNLGLGPEETNAESTSGESPKKTSERCCYKSA